MTCPYCGDVDPWLNTHRPWAEAGSYSNGKMLFTPACTCGVIFDSLGSADSRGTAKSLASQVGHPFGEKIYCSDPWHVENPIPVSQSV